MKILWGNLKEWKFKLEIIHCLIYDISFMCYFNICDSSENIKSRTKYKSKIYRSKY